MLIAMVMALGAAESAAAALSPTGKWNVEYADNMCLASRAFGTASASIVFGVRPWPRSKAAEIILITGEAPAKPVTGEGAMSLAPSGKVTTGTFWSVSSPKTGQRVMQLRVTAEDLAQMAAATTVTITAGKQKVMVAPTAIPAVLAALKTCNANLMQSWGFDPHEDDLIATEAKEKEHLSGDFYPAAAKAAGAQGTTTIIWTIGVDGRVNQCRVVATSGYAVLDQASCNEVKTLRYTPAIGKDGKPMESHTTKRVIWVLP
jgi:TonB family protein